METEGLKNNTKGLRNLPWIEKYRPTSTKEMVGFTSTVNKINVFLKNFDKKLKTQTFKKKDRAILLEGPPGVGKTTVVYAIANDLGYSVVEMNASDARTEGAIKRKLKDAIGSKNLMAYMGTGNKLLKKIILIDEVDGISGQSDRGGLAVLLKIIDKTKTPIIMTCNFYNTKFRSLYDRVDKIKCMGLKKPSILNILKKVSAGENLKIDLSALEKISANAHGDLRSAINDLQGLAQGTSNFDSNDIDGIDMHRDVEENLFSFLSIMYREKTLLGAKKVASNIDFDYNMLHKIVFSNLRNFIKDFDDYAAALQNLSLADVVMGRIKKKMDFSLLPYYFDLVSGGVVLSTTNPSLSGYKKYIAPKFWGNRMKFADDPVAGKLQSHFNISKHDIMMEIIPYIKSLLLSLPKPKIKTAIASFSEEFNIDEKLLKKIILQKS